MKDIDSSPKVSPKRPGSSQQIKKAESKMERLLVAAGAAKRAYKLARAEYKQAKKAAKQARKEFETLSLPSKKPSGKRRAKKSVKAPPKKRVATLPLRNQATPAAS
jgi:capsule polysaccharide export protein KpsE/RkpR